MMANCFQKWKKIGHSQREAAVKPGDAPQKASVRGGLVLGVLCAFVLCALPGAAEAETPFFKDVRADFGAVGDGEADDTDALRWAFASGGSVYIPQGIYRITDTVRASARTKIYGESGFWNPANQTVIFYDGPEGGTVLSAKNAQNFQMRRVTVEGNRRAGIGVYWNYASNDALLEDVGIRGTLEHGLYVSKTWYAHFNRIHVRHNLGNGVTLDRDRHEGLAEGPVNMVNFSQSSFHGNGHGDTYDGVDNFDSGYGIGILGANGVINIIGCTIEFNGGAGVYLEGHPHNVTFQGCYLEHNTQTLYRQAQAEYGEGFKWREVLDREPSGRMASIVSNLGAPRRSIVFDNCYVHANNGVWIRGADGDPVQFRHLTSPIVIWSENPGWVLVDSQIPKISAHPGVIARDMAGELASFGRFHFLEPGTPPSGFPAHSVRQGVRTLIPAVPAGLNLYVDPTRGDNANDGRGPETAWKDLRTAARLLSGTRLDTPVVIHLMGGGFSAAEFRNIDGTGSIELRSSAASNLEELSVTATSARFLLRAEAAPLQVQTAAFDRAAHVSASGVQWRPSNGQSALVASGGSRIVIEEGVWQGDRSAGPPLVLSEFSQVSVAGGARGKLAGRSRNRGGIKLGWRWPFSTVAHCIAAMKLGFGRYRSFPPQVLGTRAWPSPWAT